MKAGPSRGGAGLPEKRVTARSKLPQKKWTGLHLPTNPHADCVNTRATCATIRHQRLDGRRIVRPVHRVLIEPDRVGDLDRHRPDLHRQPHVVQHRHHVAVEVRDGARRERQRARRAVRGHDREHVIDEVELHGERAIAVGERPRGESARRDLERDRPGVVERRRLGEGDLADDLRPHVERGVGVLPRVVGERRPGIVLHGGMIPDGSPAA